MDGPQKNTREQSDYLSYLLRLWRVSEEETAWRVSLESSHTGERKGFASLDDLFSFLRGQTGRDENEGQSLTSLKGKEVKSSTRNQ